MTSRRLILIAAAGSAALLIGAFVFQAMGYAPCKLCIWQRWPHGAAIAIGAVAILASLPVLAWAGALAAAVSGAIGIYHTGVERLWWPGPDTCTASGDLQGSAEDLLNQIMEAPLVRCDEVAWAFAGLSMATWNAVLSFALAAIWIAAARRAA
ncbi:Disulfide bond formation protein B [Defluviimonas aquaemixtae]|uniref:Disulfide bond formation protein B n=1 Tax=Albidovulum aquaemixtae TaxID=1542388 RepID=A0A2R8B5F8_9RHOB|nr:disulfide bond formation protein B [Defluviimonas aquaemixtae]SPH17868.1 Disulfide bond formation protein B [Defluviimonas aquaemixtae]